MKRLGVRSRCFDAGPLRLPKRRGQTDAQREHHRRDRGQSKAMPSHKPPKPIPTRIRLRSEEADQLRAALARKKSEATNDLHQLRSEMARLASLLERIDPDFHSADIDPLRHAVRQMDRTRGRLDRS